MSWAAVSAKLASLYAAHARDVLERSSTAPTFADALAMQRLLDQVEVSNSAGQRVVLD